MHATTRSYRLTRIEAHRSFTRTILYNLIDLSLTSHRSFAAQINYTRCRNDSHSNRIRRRLMENCTLIALAFQSISNMNKVID